MAKSNFRELPKIRDSLSYVYLEYGKLEQTKLGIEFVNKQGNLQIPIASLTTIMLGPGTSVTHSAINTIANSGCLLVWTGQEGVRYYAHGYGETNKAYKLQDQAKLVSDDSSRMKVALRMYQVRFKEKFPDNLTFEQVQGIEGKRVKDEYAQLAAKYEVQWSGRNYYPDNWDKSDELNKALSTASSCLNGIVHSAIVSAGYSPGLGFIHQGRQHSFVYDIADLYKLKIAVPVAFATVKEEVFKLETEVRKRCRQAFKNLRILTRIVSDIDKILTLSSDLPDEIDPDVDPYLPAPWWCPPKEADL